MLKEARKKPHHFEGLESGAVKLTADQNEILNTLCIQRDRAIQLINAYLDQCAKSLGMKDGVVFDPQARCFMTAEEAEKRAAKAKPEAPAKVE